MQTTRPFGVTFVVSFFITKVISYLEKTLVRLDHQFYRSILDGAGIRDAVIALLCLLIVIGLLKMRSWGQLLAIIVSGVLAVGAGAIYIVYWTLGLWTLFPHGFWATTQVVANLIFEIYTVWYLLRFESRENFRGAQSPPIVSDQA